MLLFTVARLKGCFFFLCLPVLPRRAQPPTNQHIVILGVTAVGVWFNSLELPGNALSILFSGFLFFYEPFGVYSFHYPFDTHVCVRGFGWVVMDCKVWVGSHALGLARVGRNGMKLVINADDGALFSPMYILCESSLAESWGSALGMRFMRVYFM